MLDIPADWWPWLALAGFGLFHGVNPAMGWLFAVALGLHRHSGRIVLVALAPIAVGHATAVALTIALTLALDLVLNHALVKHIAAAALIAGALWHAFYGHRWRLHVGMQTGLVGLALWSFVMAGAHGAGLMVIPALMPICAAAANDPPGTTGAAVSLAAAALAVHSLAMLAAIAAISIAVYKWIDLAFLRRGWINFDRIWVGALFAGALVLLAL